ncbi:MAG: shikimate kinase [Burkholderiaceae bacterium]
MPGCGKSTIGRQLARQRQLPFRDADQEVEREIGCSIREFFEREGEEAFREIEQRTIAALLSGGLPGPGIIATGGGAVLREANRMMLRGTSTVVYLRSAPEDLVRHLGRDTQRPLLQVADPRQRLRDLFAVRDPLYRETAHIVVDTAHKSASMVVNLVSMQLDMAPPGGT